MRKASSVATALRLYSANASAACPWQLIRQAFFCDKARELNAKWRTDYQWLAPVTFLADTEPPTAFQWARRRGPSLNHAQLHSLFRKRQIKLFIPATLQVKSISESTQPPEGSQLLIPNQSTTDHVSKSASQAKPDLTTDAALALAECLRQSVLYKDNELLVINKPAGLAVQGGPGIKLSLDNIMGSALTPGSDQQLRLVHRLDRDASGCLVIARTADSAAWLSQAFAQHASAALNPNAVYKGATVQREYTAVVERSDHLAISPQGIIKEPLMGPGGTLQPATTLYHTLRSNDTVALMRLIPKTGRKHQLRIHCARALSAPILGDSRYGMTRGTVQRKVLADLNAQTCQHRQSSQQQDSHVELDIRSSQSRKPSQTDNHGSSVKAAVMPLQLHCHSVCIQKPHQKVINVTAEASICMTSLLHLLGWVQNASH